MRVASFVGGVCCRRVGDVGGALLGAGGGREGALFVNDGALLADAAVGGRQTVRLIRRTRALLPVVHQRPSKQCVQWAFVQIYKLNFLVVYCTNQEFTGTKSRGSAQRKYDFLFRAPVYVLLNI